MDAREFSFAKRNSKPRPNTRVLQFAYDLVSHCLQKFHNKLVSITQLEHNIPEQPEEVFLDKVYVFSLDSSAG